MAEKTYKQCVSCGKQAGFVDLPKGSHAARWEGSGDRPMTKCNSCGAWYPQSSISADVREKGD